MIDMFDGNIMKSKILEPSFGDGHFLLEIIRQIIYECRNLHIQDAEIVEILNENIYGFEIDYHLFNIAINNLNTLLQHNNIYVEIEWKNLRHDSIFNISKHFSTEIKFDLIIGNPPYVRVQNFDDGIRGNEKKCDLVVGNSDLYLLFINWLLKYQIKGGDFIFIVPNSLGKSKSAQKLREHFINNGTIEYIDFQDAQLFPNASVYVCIFKFKNGIFIENKFTIGSKNETYKLMHKNSFLPLTNSSLLNLHNLDLGVKNGIATLADSIFITSKISDFQSIENEYIVPIYKASKMHISYFAIFPYKIIDNKIIRFSNEIELKKMAPNLFDYLSKFKIVLLNRKIEKNTNWFEYGRSQALKDVMYEKFVIDTLIRPNQKKLNIVKIPCRTLVFSGLYTTSDAINEINNENLIKYMEFRSKDMRGGWKKISSSLFK